MSEASISMQAGMQIRRTFTIKMMMMMMMKALWVRAPFGAPRAYLVTACFSQLGLIRQASKQGNPQAVVNARKARWCTARPAARLRGARPDVARARQLTHTAPRAQGKAAARCGAVQGTTMFNVTRASAGLDVISGTFAGEPYTPVDPGVAAAQAQLQTAYSAGISDAGAVRGLRSAGIRQCIYTYPTLHL